MTRGSTYNEVRDGKRINRLHDRVFKYMADGQWHLLGDIAIACHGSEAGVSARLRDFRKPPHGGHRVDAEYVEDGLWRYRLVTRPMTQGVLL